MMLLAKNHEFVKVVYKILLVCFWRHGLLLVLGQLFRAELVVV